jgi:hypothetical protein
MFTGAGGSPLVPIQTGGFTLRARVPLRHERAFLAATLATAFEPKRVVPKEDTALVLGRCARRTAEALTDASERAEATRVADLAEQVRDHVRAHLPAEQRSAVMVGVVRELLTDAPDTCTDLDRDLKRAAEAYGIAPRLEHQPAIDDVVALVERLLTGGA